MEEQLTLIQRLAKIRNIADLAVRDKKGHNYKYADISQILAKVRGGMKTYRVSLIPSIVPGTTHLETVTTVNTKFDQKGSMYDKTATEIHVTSEMNFRWVNDDDPSDYIDVPWFITGAQADPSQAFGSGLTYCTRYFLSNYFQISQIGAEDVDDYRSKQKAAELAEDRAVAEGIISQFDVLLKTYLSDHPDKNDELKKFISRFVKNGNYFAIKEPSLAAKLLEDFNNTYSKGE